MWHRLGLLKAAGIVLPPDPGPAGRAGPDDFIDAAAAAWTAARYARPIHEALPDLPLENIVSEPVGRNTAAAIALSATSPSWADRIWSDAAAVKASVSQGLFRVVEEKPLPYRVTCDPRDWESYKRVCAEEGVLAFTVG